jgi:hypothetical protein
MKRLFFHLIRNESFCWTVFYGAASFLIARGLSLIFDLSFKQTTGIFQFCMGMGLFMEIYKK